MKPKQRYFESALWFYIGLVFVGILTDTVHQLRFIFGDDARPEGDLLLLLAFFRGWQFHTTAFL
jgi:hypothetical protein